MRPAYSEKFRLTEEQFGMESSRSMPPEPFLAMRLAS